MRTKSKRSFSAWATSVVDQIKSEQESRRQQIEQLIEENDEAVIAEAIRFENRLDETNK